jgi:hypothetical protein
MVLHNINAQSSDLTFFDSKMLQGKPAPNRPTNNKAGTKFQTTLQQTAAGPLFFNKTGPIKVQHNRQYPTQNMSTTSNTQNVDDILGNESTDEIMFNQKTSLSHTQKISNSHSGLNEEPKQKMQHS